MCNNRLFIVYEQRPNVLPMVAVVVEILHARLEGGLESMTMVTKKIHYKSPNQCGLYSKAVLAQLICSFDSSIAQLD
jgi:hypothetical protein